MWDKDITPLFESSPLRILAEQAGQKVADDFFRSYLELLPVRAGNILHGLAAGDTDATLEALVSLRVTSAMAGAVQLEKYCRQLGAQITSGCGANLTAVASVLSENIRRLVQEAGHQGYQPISSDVIGRSWDR